jgi:hypothetical protein
MSTNFYSHPLCSVECKHHQALASLLASQGANHFHVYIYRSIQSVQLSSSLVTTPYNLASISTQNTGTRQRWTTRWTGPQRASSYQPCTAAYRLGRLVIWVLTWMSTISTERIISHTYDICVKLWIWIFWVEEEPTNWAWTSLHILLPVISKTHFQISLDN